MKLKDILSENLIKIYLSGHEKRQVIEEMVDLLAMGNEQIIVLDDLSGGFKESKILEFCP